MPDKATAKVFTFEVTRTGNTAVVKCHGKLVAGVGDDLTIKVKELLPDTRRIVLDLTDLTRLDSMGIGKLVRLYVSARSAGCNLELMNLGKQIRELLGTANLLSAFSIIGEHGIKLG